MLAWAILSDVNTDQDSEDATSNTVATAGRAAAAWVAIDPDPTTRNEVQALLAAESPDLVSLFSGRIAFGTAGLRAEMGPGPTRMNRLVVQQTTAGLMSWLTPGARVVIGFDARHNSAAFAQDVAQVVAGAGGIAELLPEPLPTPVLAFAVLSRHADAGIMITASHNPPADNGYKLYLADGIQLVNPADAEVAQAIENMLETPLVLADPDHERIIELGPEVAEGHLQAAVSACVGSDRKIDLVYTAMHGVGGAHMVRAMSLAGFGELITVPEQFEPDPDFPTVAFPNPEEAGALDLALALAVAHGADAVLANDPDADRLAIAVPNRVELLAAGENVDAQSEAVPPFVSLSGDQVGILLADYLIGLGSGPDRLVSNSLVSSRLVAEMATTAQIQSRTTLTGFKWVARPIVEHPDLEFVLGYEEALGYCVGSKVRDKDGISAALVAAEMLASLKRQGLTVWDRIDALAHRHGAYLSGPVTIRLPGADGVTKRAQLMRRVQTSPPESLAGAHVESFLDLSLGETLPAADGVVLLYTDQTQVIVRPSGTEPKLKAYIEVIEPVLGDLGSGKFSPEELALSQERAKRRLVRYQSELTAYFDD